MKICTMLLFRCAVCGQLSSAGGGGGGSAASNGNAQCATLKNGN